MLLQIQEPECSRPIQAIGIDLGTTHTVVVIPGYGPLPLIPSVVAYQEDGSCAVGDVAVHMPGAIHSIKRLIGKVQDFPFGDKRYSPVVISADILKFACSQVVDRLGYFVNQAVITVPAYFDEAARSATREAAALAGLQVLRLLNEPTAAAVAYGLDRGVEGLYGVYDLGGGTFDFSVLKMEKGVFQVLATNGDLNLGGDDFDSALTHFLDNPNVNLLQVRAAKELLSKQDHVLLAGQKVTRAEFEDLIMPLIHRTLLCVQDALNQGGVLPEDFQGLIFVGGSTRVPAVFHQVRDFFQKEPLKYLDPDLGVALGAGIQAQALTEGAQHLLLDVVPLSLGLETLNGAVERLIPRNTPIPTAVTQKFTTFQDGQTAIRFHVLQGEDEHVSGCRSLGKFEMRNLPALKAGLLRVSVTFTVDADGLTTITAFEQTTQKQETIQVNPIFGLRDDDMQFLMESAQRNQANRLLKDGREILVTFGHLFQDSEKLDLEEMCSQLDEALTNQAGVSQAMDRFIKLFHPLVQRIFR